MKKFAGYVLRLTGVLLMACFYFASAQHADKLKGCERTAQILMERTSLTYAQVKEIKAGEEEQDVPKSFAAWNQKNEVTVQNKDLYRQHTVSAVGVFGRSDLLIPGSSWLDESDREGCLIDEKTARELFGSTGVAGQVISVGEKEKTIRGILYGVSDTVLYEADETETFTNLTVYMEAGATVDQIRQDFMMRHGLEGRFVRMDILKTVADLARLTFSIPPDLIPTKWSDFGFWSETFEKEKESVLLLMLTEKQKPMELYMKELYPAVAYGLLAIWLAVSAVSKGIKYLTCFLQTKFR